MCDFSILKLNNQEGTHGDLHLRKLAAAGLSHVHLLPTFDFGSVPEILQERREAELPSDLGKSEHFWLVEIFFVWLPLRILDPQIWKG